jgi:molybdate transport system ATP-binding protein
MQYLAFCDPHHAADAVGRSGKTVSSRDVVLSGFYDTIGLYDRPGAGHAAIADAWVATLGIADLVSAETLFTRLSLGQQKLVLLCRALVKRPRLLVLDEPTHALSAQSRDRFLAALEAARDAADVAVLYVSHRMDEIEALNCDDVITLGAKQQTQAFDGMSCTAFKLDQLATTTPRSSEGWTPPGSWD